MNLCHGFNIPATFFITAEPAHLLAREVDTMQTQGHEVGCHGLTHGHEEDYDTMPESTQRAYIEQATTKLQTLTGGPVYAFRGPRVKTSATTLKLLVEHGYLADSSVCSQRLDLISSNLINPGWIFRLAGLTTPIPTIRLNRAIRLFGRYRFQQRLSLLSPRPCGFWACRR
ncbi:MAG: polysaccharide deacetylase family protein [Anaerolineales bacterium]|nr:polysaccharide deacetylase family protein [Anaerolineales bacterium]